MDKLLRSGSSALVSGTVAGVVMAAALAWLAKREGKGALQPVNATSHWLHGDQAGAVREASLSHTGIGFATHHVSAVFWAFIFENYLATQPPRTPMLMLRDASVMSAIAAAVDYGLTPKRFTPGWEEVLPPRSIGVTYAAMALGLAAGAMLTQQLATHHGNVQATQKERHMSDIERVWELMAKVQFCMFSTWTGSRLRSRPMYPHLNRSENSVRFLTDVRQHKDEEVEEFPQVCLSFSDPRAQKYVSVSGTARLANDRELIRKLWSFPSKAWWDSAEDPNIRVITVAPHEAEFWDSPGTVISYVKMAAAAISNTRPEVGENRKVSMESM